MLEPTRRACGGFTLVELVLVLAITGVLAAVAVPRMVDRGAFPTHGAAAEVRTALRYAQRQAMAKSQGICVNTSATGLTLWRAPPACNVPVLGPGGAQYVVVMPSGVGFAPSPSFSFDELGRPSATPISFLIGGAITVTVTRETGYVQ